MNIKEWIIATAIFGLPLASFGQNSATGAKPPQTTGNTGVKMPPNKNVCDSVATAGLEGEEKFLAELVIEKYGDIVDEATIRDNSNATDYDGNIITTQLDNGDELEVLKDFIRSLKIDKIAMIEGESLIVKPPFANRYAIYSAKKTCKVSGLE